VNHRLPRQEESNTSDDRQRENSTSDHPWNRTTGERGRGILPKARESCEGSPDNDHTDDTGKYSKTWRLCTGESATDKQEPGHDHGQTRSNPGHAGAHDGECGEHWARGGTHELEFSMSNATPMAIATIMTAMPSSGITRERGIG
jgi:hypothetical protein